MIVDLTFVFGVALITLFAGVPVLLCVALSTAAYAVLFDAMPPVVLVQSLVSGLDRSGLEAIAYFIFLGSLMNTGGLSQRLVDLALALLGHRQGGLSQVNIVASMLFGGISGSAVADVSAVGSIMIPAMRREGYHAAWAAAVTATSASIGLLIPPSIPLVLFALFNDVSVSDLFVAGIVPGLLMGVYLMLVSAWIAKRRSYPRHGRATLRERRSALIASLPVLALPILITLSLYTGIATASETGALAVLYALILVLCLQRPLTLHMLRQLATNAALDSARVLSIIAVSGGTIWIIANLGATKSLVSWVEALSLPPVLLLPSIAIGLVLLGTVIGPSLQMILIIPALAPVVVAADIHIVHYGIVSVLASALALVTPPVGVLLFLTATQSDSSIGKVAREALPLIAAMLLLLATLVVFPTLSIGLLRV